MGFTDVPTEQTTAITDLVLAALSLGSALHLLRHRIADPWKANLWAWVFGLLSLASGLGAVAHGFNLSAATNRLLWQPLNIALGLAVALFLVGATYDLWGRHVARKILPIMIGIGLAFFAVTHIVTETFLVFVIYEAVAMLFALIIYARITLRHGAPGASLMVVGVVISIVAAAFQASKGIEVTLIWKFDHNGLFHLLQIVSVLTLVAGLRTGLQVRPDRSCSPQTRAPGGMH